VGEKRTAVFLDRDGVINEVVFRDGKPASPRTMAEFCFVEGIAEPLSRLHAAGMDLFIVSNQPDVARGHLDPRVLEEMTEKIMKETQVKQVFVCTHDDADSCDCRKPKPGMLLQIAEKNGIDLSRSFMVGDSWKDIEAGSGAGVKTVLIRRDYNSKVLADYTVETLSEAADFILNERRL
jgi:D-glycero-D-manno-heptose 1,7-bisphosphate phosphatase